MSSWKHKSLTALGVCALVTGCGAFVAPTASAAAATPLPAAVAERITLDELPVQQSDGWEAVTGPAAGINDVRASADAQGIGTVVMYTGQDETGRAILIFTGDNNAPTAFQTTGGAVVHSVADDTDQPWYVYDDDGSFDATVAPQTARNIPAADAALTNFDPTHNLSSPITRFSF